MASTYTPHEGPRLGTDGKVYDFIEVGTADHTTITHWCAHDERNASWTCAEIGLRRKDLGPAWCARGLAVDPSSHHLAALPNLPNVHKVEVAMDECCGQDEFYFVSQKTSKETQVNSTVTFPTSLMQRKWMSFGTQAHWDHWGNRIRILPLCCTTLGALTCSRII